MGAIFVALAVFAVMVISYPVFIFADWFFGRALGSRETLREYLKKA